MKPITILIVVLFTFVVFLAVTFVLITSCTPDNQPKPTKSVTHVGGSAVQTIEHDGHLFIMARQSITHHPGCPCIRLPEGGFVPAPQ